MRISAFPLQQNENKSSSFRDLALFLQELFLQKAFSYSTY